MAVSFCVFSGLAEATHGQVEHAEEAPWLDTMKDKNGFPCCGVVDCQPVDGAVELYEDPPYKTFVEVTVNGVPVETTVMSKKIVDSLNTTTYICFVTAYLEDGQEKRCEGHPPIGPDACIRCIIRPRSNW